MNERGDSVNGEYFEWSEAVRAARRCEVPVDGVVSGSTGPTWGGDITWMRRSSQ